MPPQGQATDGTHGEKIRTEKFKMKKVPARNKGKEMQNHLPK